MTAQRGAAAVAALVRSADGLPRLAADAFGAVADAVASSMGGTSGALLEIFFRAGRVHILRVNASDCRRGKQT